MVLRNGIMNTCIVGLSKMKDTLLIFFYLLVNLSRLCLKFVKYRFVFFFSPFLFVNCVSRCLYQSMRIKGRIIRRL